jgi:DNA end-binding protein Ku
MSDAKSVSAVEAVIKKKRPEGLVPEHGVGSDPGQPLKLIAARKKANKPTMTKASKSPKDDGDEKSNVVNIIDALKKSVAKDLQSRKAG